MKPAQTAGEHITLTTRIAPEEVLQRLSRAIETQMPILLIFPQPKHWLFVGSIQGSSFSISRIPSGKRFYQNTFDGVVKQTENGSLIELVIRPYDDNPLIRYFLMTVVAFWCVFFGGGLLYAFVSGLVPPGFGWFLLIVGLFCFLYVYAVKQPPSKMDLDAVTALGHLKSIWQAEIVEEDSHEHASG